MFIENYVVVVPDGFGSAAAISLGSTHACVIETSGEVKCWGENEFGQSSVPQVPIRAGYKGAALGHFRTGSYTFEAICGTGETYQYAAPRGVGAQHTLLKLGCWTDAGEYQVTCGDGNVDEGETCDDGNRVSGDGCNATCSEMDG